jgi:hypothetical protein
MSSSISSRLSWNSEENSTFFDPSHFAPHDMILPGSMT